MTDIVTSYCCTCKKKMSTVLLGLVDYPCGSVFALAHIPLRKAESTDITLSSIKPLIHCCKPHYANLMLKKYLVTARLSPVFRLDGIVLQKSVHFMCSYFTIDHSLVPSASKAVNSSFWGEKVLASFLFNFSKSNIFELESTI